MKVFSYRLAVGIFLASLATACSGDGTGSNPNDPATTPTLTADVQPILSLNCASSGCHSGTTPAQNLGLSTGLTFGETVNVPSTQVPTMSLVNPNQPTLSYLVHKINGTHTTVGGTGGRMPLGAAALTAVEIEVVTQWVAAGAPDN